MYFLEWATYNEGHHVATAFTRPGLLALMRVILRRVNEDVDLLGAWIGRPVLPPVGAVFALAKERRTAFIREVGMTIRGAKRQGFELPGIEVYWCPRVDPDRGWECRSFRCRVCGGAGFVLRHPTYDELYAAAAPWRKRSEPLWASLWPLGPGNPVATWLVSGDLGPHRKGLSVVPLMEVEPEHLTDTQAMQHLNFAFEGDRVPIFPEVLRAKVGAQRLERVRRARSAILSAARVRENVVRQVAWLRRVAENVSKG